MPVDIPLRFPIKEPFHRMFGCNVGLQAAYQMNRQGDDAILLPFAPDYMKYMAVKIQIPQP